MLGLYFSSKLDWGSYNVSIAKTPSMTFLSSEAALYLSHRFAWDTVVAS